LFLLNHAAGSVVFPSQPRNLLIFLNQLESQSLVLSYVVHSFSHAFVQKFKIAPKFPCETIFKKMHAFHFPRQHRCVHISSLSLFDDSL
jgi:hypothetical protein